MIAPRWIWTGVIAIFLHAHLISSLLADPVKPPNDQVDSATKDRCLQILRKALVSDQFWPSMHAAEALTLAGCNDEVLIALKGRLDREPDLKKRCGLAREQVRAGDRSKVSELQAVLSNPDPDGHAHACESLYKVKEVGDVTLLKAAMNDTKLPNKVLMAAGALARSGDEAAMTFIRDQLRSQQTENHGLAAWLLGVLGERGDIPLLKQALARAETPRNRAFIENTLGLLGDDAGRQALINNLRSTDVGVRADAAYMVSDAGLSDTIPRLKSLLDDENLDVTVRAAQGLIKLSQNRPD